MVAHTEYTAPLTHRNWFLWGLKACLSTLLLLWALHKVPMANLLEALRTAHPAWVLASLLVFLGGIGLFDAFRLSASGSLVMDPSPPLGRWVLLNLTSRAFLYLLPSGVGQEGYLWLKLRNYGWKHGSCAFVVVLIRTTGLAFWCLALANALRSPAFQQSTLWVLRGNLSRPGAWAGAGALLFSVSLLLPFILGRLGRLEGYSSSVKAWAVLLLSTVGTAFTCAAAFELAGRAFGISFGLAQAAGCTTLLFVGMVLPISLGGIGVQEGILLMVGKGLGMPPGAVLGLSCILHLQRLAMTLLGISCLVAVNRGLSLWGSRSQVAAEEGKDGRDHAVDLLVPEAMPKR